MTTFARILLGYIFFSSGMGKLSFVMGWPMLVPGFIGPVSLSRELAPHGLALYGHFIMACQIAIGLLVMWRRSSLLGLVMLVPMIVNILVVTISLQWRGTPYVNGLLLIWNLALMWPHRARLLPLVLPPKSA